MLDLLERLKDGNTWREVADVLGGQYSGAFWRLVAIGERHATTEQANIVRAHFGLDPIAETPAETVTAAGVDRVVKVSKRPNTAILAAVSGDVIEVDIKAGKLAVGESPSCSVTLRYSDSAKRTRAKRTHGDTMADLALLPPSAFSTVRGKTGNLEQISATISAARQALDYGNIEADLQLWGLIAGVGG